MTQLTDGDRNLLAYYCIERGEAQGWSDWEIKKHLVKKEFPVLYECIERQYMADQMLKLAVEATNFGAE